MRPRFPRLAYVAAAITAVAAGLAGCGTSSGGGAKGAPPIVIGISLPLTGGFKTDGLAFERGYRLWQSEVNEHGGIKGRQIQLVILDDHSDPNKTAADYKTLITTDHVDLTFGPFSSLLTIPAGQTTAHYGYALIEGAGDADTVFHAPSNLAHHNIFSPSLPVADYMEPFDKWIKSLPASERPKNAAYPTVNDPFATPAVQTAQRYLQSIGIKTVYTSLCPNQKCLINEVPKAYPAPARKVAHLAPQMVVLGSTDVPTVAEFLKIFAENHYSPKIFVAVSGPDQGQAFLSAVGKADANGMMVPDGWYGGFANSLNDEMVEQYIARYGGTAASINADVAEAYSVGQIAADAITAVGVHNRAIIRYLHTSGAKLQTVQGPAVFNSLGENPDAVAFISQWQDGNFLQVLPVTTAGASKPIFRT
jgi:branched-chain amino acid transport system substrate-binding protein